MTDDTNIEVKDGNDTGASETDTPDNRLKEQELFELNAKAVRGAYDLLEKLSGKMTDANSDQLPKLSEAYCNVFNALGRVAEMGADPNYSRKALAPSSRRSSGHADISDTKADKPSSGSKSREAEKDEANEGRTDANRTDFGKTDKADTSRADKSGVAAADDVAKESLDRGPSPSRDGATAAAVNTQGDKTAEHQGAERTIPGAERAIVKDKK